MNRSLLVNRDCFIDFLRKADFREVLRTLRLFSSVDRWILAPPGCDGPLRPFTDFETLAFCKKLCSYPNDRPENTNICQSYLS